MHRTMPALTNLMTLIVYDAPCIYRELEVYMSFLSDVMAVHLWPFVAL